MITESELYWILKLDDIRNLLIGCTIVLGFTSVVLIIMTVSQFFDDCLCDYDDWRRSKVARLSVYAALIVCSFAAPRGSGQPFGASINPAPRALR
jgi:hypothetical protein